MGRLSRVTLPVGQRLKISFAMRKQYHFRPSKQGLLAWDVDRLIALSEQLPARLIPLSAIRELDEAYWFSHEGDTPTCRAIIEHLRLIQEVDLRYPVILCSQGRVMDGMHRIARAVLEGRSDIEARQFDSDPEPDYVGADPGALSYVRSP